MAPPYGRRYIETRPNLPLGEAVHKLSNVVDEGAVGVVIQGRDRRSVKEKRRDERCNKSGRGA